MTLLNFYAVITITFFITFCFAQLVD